MNNKFEFKNKYDIHDLTLIMEMLRSENGCPWDREQDHQSIRKNFLEETYEVLEAIDNEDPELLREELGDVLLQVVFHSQMEAERGTFDFNDVADEICKKLIIRHPHVFGNVQVENSAEVLSNWERIKKEQKGQTKASDSLLSVPKVLPSLMRSTKVQQRASRAGFDWPDVFGAFEKLEEETKELKAAIDHNSREEIFEELGDLLFAAVNVSRFLKVDSEEALAKACDKFISRFSKVERLAEERGIDIVSSDLKVLDTLWDEAKLTK